MRNEWLDQGYKDFAQGGPENLSIKQIAIGIGVSRSSFYHHFAEMELFVDELLARHWEICQEFNKAGKETCNNMIPDLYDLMGQYPIPLKFSWQLFRYRHIPRYNFLFVKTYQASAEAFTLDLFARHMDLDLEQGELSRLYLTLGEAWYSRLDPRDLSAATLCKHSEDIMRDLVNFMDTQIYSSLRNLEVL